MLRNAILLTTICLVTAFAAQDDNKKSAQNANDQDAPQKANPAQTVDAPRTGNPPQTVNPPQTASPHQTVIPPRTDNPAQKSGVHQTGDAHQTAHATLKDVQGANVGDISFHETANGVLIKADLNGLPQGIHAIHIHETGKCEAPDFKSAGGHFNPTQASHGYLEGSNYHAGDLPNFDVPESGKTTLEIMSPAFKLSTSGAKSVFDSDGSAVIVHAKADDYHSQPSGDAGDRIACGVIENGSMKEGSDLNRKDR